MHKTRAVTQAADYWRTLVTLGPRRLEAALDVPLNEAIARCRHFTAWSVLLVLAAWISVHRAQWMRWTARLPGTLSERYVTLAFLLVLGAVVAVPVAYGMLRLYTLIAHVMALNILKARGQRLRLLNVETTLLPLAVPAALAISLHGLGFHTIALVLDGIIGLYACWLLTHGFHLVFHHRHDRAFALLIGTVLLSTFILAIGMLAAAVTLAVIGFFGAVLLRLFVHHRLGQ